MPKAFETQALGKATRPSKGFFFVRRVVFFPVSTPPNVLAQE